MLDGYNPLEVTPNPHGERLSDDEREIVAPTDTTTENRGVAGSNPALATAYPYLVKAMADRATRCGGP